MSVHAFPRRGALPAVGDVVTLDGARCVVERHAPPSGPGPIHLLLRLIDGRRAGMAVTTDHLRITMALDEQ